MASDEDVVCPDLVTALQRHQAKANVSDFYRAAPYARTLKSRRPSMPAE
jgi:hypothetical protein